MRTFGSGRWHAALAVLGLGVVLGWYWLQPEASANENATAVTAAASPAAALPGAQGPGGDPVSAAEAARREREVRASVRLERAEQVYRSYRESTRFPPDSRPLEEHPDQARPFAPVEDEARLRDNAGRPFDVHVSYEEAIVAGQLFGADMGKDLMKTVVRKLIGARSHYLSRMQ